MDEKTKEKLLKLLRLSKEGVGGEAVNAEAALTRLLAEHGMTLADIDDAAIAKVRVQMKYNDPNDKQLFVQVVAMVCDQDDVKIARWNGTRTLFCDVTPAQKAEIIVRYELLRKAYKAEVETLFKAFIIKHKVWSSKPSTERRPMDDETLRALKMAGSLKDVELTKRIGKKQDN